MRSNRSAESDGIVIASGFGLKVYVNRGHLVVHDGIGRQRETRRLARATSGLERLVVIGHSGFVTFEALRWIRDIGAAFCQIGRDGEVIAVSSADRLLNPKLRRAQALAADSEVGVRVVRELVVEKLRGQIALLEELRERFPDLRLATQALPIVDKSAREIERADDFRGVRGHEAVAGRWYWKTLAQVPITFDRTMSRRVPEHWRRGGPRTSRASGFKGPRKAATPMHAAINYSYAVLETEARIALQAYGFDPALGIIHTDKRYRGSLAADLMEPVRPLADRVVLQLLGDPLRGQDVYETREGVCRLGSALTKQLTLSSPELREALIPHAAELSNVLLGRRGGRGHRPRRREPGTVGKAAKLHTTPRVR